MGIEPTFIGEGSPKEVAQQFFNKLGKDSVFIPSSNLSLGTVQELIPASQKEVVNHHKNSLHGRRNFRSRLFGISLARAMWKLLLMNTYQNQKVVSIGPSTMTKALNEKGVQDVVETYESIELALVDMHYPYFNPVNYLGHLVLSEK